MNSSKEPLMACFVISTAFLLLFPLFYLEKIGCYCWGFVAGKYQTYEPWESMWTRYDNGGGRSIDFTKWFHDLYRPNHRPYDPHETELIREFCDYADADFARQQKAESEKTGAQ